MTGLEKDVARFQAISIITRTGYTTKEAETVSSHPVRRHIGAFLILFGLFSLAVIISSISTLLADNFYTMKSIYITIALVIILLLLKTPVIQKNISNRIQEREYEKYVLQDLPIDEVLLVRDSDVLIDLEVYSDSDLLNKTIKDVLVADEDINFLFIKRGDVVIRKERYLTKISEGDKLFLYGNKYDIKKVFDEDLKRYKERKNIDIPISFDSN
ncbi:TrkA C-terminal domain-containing protein [Pseudalkalibacillus caeni]|uniref:RCK C-terminal domain-containing protein n=1 Tax=Exobacillus caeni TaxID=2574798 RepID=A0A5R9F935_9BACL|nr:TrkA C-terminal domain-containing protein [Pseudalkalibacillus caeni]TLS38128.1 hypothetical protein FCL54_06200 [Pseudalkalibacillus caeni]